MLGIKLISVCEYVEKQETVALTALFLSFTCSDCHVTFINANSEIVSLF